MERCPTVPVDPEDVPAHVVATDRELAARRSPQRIEGKHITGHVPLEGKGTTTPVAPPKGTVATPLTCVLSCRRSRRSSPYELPSPQDPVHAPATFSVTSVRSIQSSWAQPSKNTTEIPQEHSREAPHRASSWRRFGPQDRVDAMERHPTVPATPEDLPAHVVAAHRELAAPRAPRRLEGEHITGHAPLDRKGGARERHPDNSRDLRPVLFQIQAHVAVTIAFPDGSG